MNIPPRGPFADRSARLLALPFSAMGVSLDDGDVFTGGMPQASTCIPRHNLVVGATVCAAPMFRQVVPKVARDWRHDVMLVRTRLFPATVGTVRVDIAVVGGDDIVAHDLAFYRHRDGSLWLVPPVRGVFLRIDERGLVLERDPPFARVRERFAGLSRAASELLRIAGRGQVR